MLLFRLTVRGHSMEPAIRNGSQIWASSLPYLFKNPKVGDVVVFKKENKLIIKRISKIKNGKYEMSGDNKKDSRDFGVINRSEIVGKIVKI